MNKDVNRPFEAVLALQVVVTIIVLPLTVDTLRTVARAFDLSFTALRASLAHYFGADPRSSCGRRHLVSMARNSWYGHLCLPGAGALGRVAAVIHSLGRDHLQVLGEGAKHVRRGGGRGKD